ncbi:hypothetical protein GCM10010170_104650 [Dactylosporangium salmoneum]|uniref:Uncharacterized protein n=1 Tax=Dactylosporangium salmoneum TaxID=53361 RepID=A0ABN3I0D8_9ACTN
MTRPAWVVHCADLVQHHEWSLETKLFDVIEAAVHVDGRQHVLLLDSVDECKARAGTLAGILERRLPKLIGAGLRVVASCRSGELSAAVRNLFQRLGGDPALVELQPLRASDVWRYAETHSLDGGEFLRQVRAARAESLAVIPQTLELLCAAASFDVTLFERRVDLYEFGVSKLLELPLRDNEPSEGGRARAPRSLWLAAERAAALTLLTGASGLWTAPTSAERGIVHYQEVTGGEPDGTGSVIEVVAADAQAALAGPLFAPAGPDVRTVVHRSFGAYLTARFLQRRQLSAPQLQSLLVGSAAGRAIVPQLRETAAWLIALDPGCYQWLVEADPLTLVRYNLVPDDSGTRRVVVATLLAQAHEYQHLLRLDDRFGSLVHPDLAAQLAPDLRRAGPASGLALAVLADSYVPGLEAALLSICLDPARPLWDRQRSLMILADQQADEQLLAVIEHSDVFLAGDQDDQLLGALLDQTWPRLMSTADMLARLVPSARLRGGAYGLFLHEVADRLAEEELPTALIWVERLFGIDKDGRQTSDPDPAVQGSLPGVVEDVCTRAAATRNDEYRQVLARLFRTRIATGDDEPPFRLDDTDRDWRRGLVLEMLRADNVDAALGAMLGFARDSAGVPLLDDDDFAWACSTAMHHVDHPARGAWHVLATRLYNPAAAAHDDIAWQYEGTPLWSGLEGHFYVHVESPLADILRRAHARRSRNDEQVLATARDGYVQQMQARLTQLATEPESYWIVDRLLDVDVARGEYRDRLADDLSKLPGFMLLSDTDQQRIDEAAWQYVSTADVVNLPKHRNATTIYHPLIAAYRAVARWHRLDPQRLAELPVRQWAACAEAIFTYPAHVTDHDADGQVKADLLTQAATRAPAALADVVNHLLTTFTAENQPLRWLRELAPVMNSQLADALAAHLDGQPHLVNHAEVLDLLLSRNDQRGIDWCTRQLDGVPDVNAGVITANAMLRHVPEQGLPLVVAVLHRAPSIGREIALALGQHLRHRALTVIGYDDAVADLYEWLAVQFPPQEAPEDRHTGLVSPQRQLELWRDELLHTLVQRGTASSLAALEQLQHRQPQLPLDRAVLLAREVTRQQTWTPPALVHLHQLLQDRRRRLVTDAADLQAAVLEALETIGGWLTGETPQAFALWNVTKVPGEPKDENSISDWYCHGLRLLLKSSGVVINREVEARRKPGAGIGERHDIRVEATDSTGHTICVVIEVKGCWNDSTTTNLTEQLVGQYLKPAGHTHGVYLVACFPPEQVGGDKRSKVARHSIAALIEGLTGQAQQLPLPFDVAVVVHDIALPG